ncbi:MAG: tRNA (N6-threonylcarbamoyladenosine(37)-N6)-methyltransferase TrmO [Myxococcota bacterium]|nr:tRNA (N6-threonylcarbamoyladenosine(37)-N6)-methyltransferase TrmO [Myxococcota bacterium]
MPTYSFEGKQPVIAQSTYVAPEAVIIGNVTLGEKCYVGPGAILRGDWGKIKIDDRTIIEELVFVHARPDDVTRIGTRVTLGHGSMVHNATIDEGAVIGMRAVVSDFSTVGAYTIIGEMSLVKRGQSIPPHKIAVGVPAAVIKDVEDDRLLLHRNAKNRYVNLAKKCNNGAIERMDSSGRSGDPIPATYPIGVIRTPFKEAAGTPIQGPLSKDAKGTVVLDAPYQKGLDDLDGFSHVTLIYALHRIQAFKLKVKPYLDSTERGIFATRSPCRPNPIGITTVRLSGIDGCHLEVNGVDMLDETPLFDIKPAVPDFDWYPKDAVRCGWFEPHLKCIREGKTVPVADDRFHQRPLIGK